MLNRFRTINRSIEAKKKKFVRLMLNYDALLTIKPTSVESECAFSSVAYFVTRLY